MKQRVPKVQIAIYVGPEIVARIAHLAEELGRQRPGTWISRADAARAVIHVGLETMERELGIRPAPAARDARKKRRTRVRTKGDKP